MPAMFVMGGIQLPFFPVWLKAKGLDPQMIGLVLAAPMVARVFAMPLVARAGRPARRLARGHHGGELARASPALSLVGLGRRARPRS